ncbi:MAG: hypothetical protein ABH851_00190 [Methanobacteriota archaeon]
MMISDTQKADIVKLRGLGYTQKEIAAKLKIKQNAVSYHLQEINHEARAQGDNPTYIKTLTNGYLKQILETIQYITPKK